MKISLIKQQAKEQKISLREIAERAGIKRATFFNYLGGKTPFTVEALEKVANILDIPIQMFFEEPHEKKGHSSNETKDPYKTDNMTDPALLEELKTQIASGRVPEDIGHQLVKELTMLYSEVENKGKKLTALLKAIEEL